MPHPERAMEFSNLYDWPLVRERMKQTGVAVDEGTVYLKKHLKKYAL